ncbi:uncharacterized protein Triagg1_60 [Trichoderma aggressivum f. europaeum]|uniref:peptidylprolyl isomerase n=1 Tax=Trichoderma aggressivum f. europaeum TaxID=173218 RepID=A0AAE1JI85_9HYPO|nr:hypothetical protein Triagg1_60 [Trichoderma aggressivum f. europaeum]
MASEPTKTILEEGSGDQPKARDTVIMGYTGWLKDTSQPDNKGKKFDSSYDRPGEGFSTQIGVGQVIKGWDKGVVTMKLGEKARLDIPSHLAYGSRSIPGVIPANSDLIFDVHLKRIIPFNG